MSKTTLSFKRSTYCDNSNLAIMAYEDGQPYGVLTVNIDYLMPDCACVDTNNWPDAEQIIKEQGFGKPLGRSIQSGFCSYPIYQFDLSKIPEA